MYLCIIPARAGSKRVKNKNLRPLNGSPMISYAIQAAKTVVRMTELLEELDFSGGPSPKLGNSMARYVNAKEIHAKKAKDDVLVLWTDYFKPEHLSKYPDLHEKIWNACKLGSFVKVNVDLGKAKEVW